MKAEDQVFSTEQMDSLRQCGLKGVKTAFFWLHTNGIYGNKLVLNEDGWHRMIDGLSTPTMTLQEAIEYVVREYHPLDLCIVSHDGEYAMEYKQEAGDPMLYYTSHMGLMDCVYQLLKAKLTGK